MNHWNSFPSRQAVAVLCAGVLAFVAACGGGGSAEPAAQSLSTLTASSYSQGPISGFGSVIVNGVRWDDSAAAISDDDGGARQAAELKLGMVVEIDGAGLDRAKGSGKAMAIRFGSEMLGPIASIDSATSSMVVLGVTVEITSSTVFDPSIAGGLAGLAQDEVVEVHGLFDAANNRVVATRVEPEAGATSYRLRGVVSALDSAAKTFKLGTQTVSYASLPALPAWVAAGVQAKARLQTTQVGGAWVAMRLIPIGVSLHGRPDAQIEGTITAFTSSAAFEVNGLKVDASKATFPDGSADLALGTHVEVEGAVVEGVLVAAVVKVDDDRHGNGMTPGGMNPGGGGTAKKPPRQFELHGLISGVDTTAKTFALRGLSVSYAGTVNFIGGDASALVDGARIEVKGTLATDLTHIDAVRIEFEK
jgi:Domain of unknown function (DUF5666)